MLNYKGKEAVPGAEPSGMAELHPPEDLQSSHNASKALCAEPSGVSIHFFKCGISLLVQEEVAAIARQDMSAYSLEEPPKAASSSGSSRGGASQQRQLEDPESRQLEDPEVSADDIKRLRLVTKVYFKRLIMPSTRKLVADHTDDHPVIQMFK
eukprot:scaffold96812_cov15-Tisochrysis_lutea.AAC.1